MADRYSLEHFFYGQLARDGKPHGNLRLLASSPGISQDDIPDWMRGALLPPLPVLPGNWGVVRLKAGEFALVQSQVNSAGAAVLHVALLPVELLRGLGGNVQSLLDLLRPVPVFDRLGEPLYRLDFTPLPPDEAHQTDAMLALMTCTRDRLDVVEKLLAAIIQGVQVVVFNAPNDLTARAAFVEGLLALLPHPARYGVTFALHTLPTTQVDVQIRFVSAATPIPFAVLYDWNDSRLANADLEDSYSRFIISQLRLDTQVAIEQTAALTPVAAWRLKQGNALAQALAYAAYRLSLDNALLNQLPVQAQDAARVLAEDPTLDPALRTIYSQHVLTFALALENAALAGPVAAHVARDSDLESAVLSQLEAALHTGKGGFVYHLLLDWMQQPDGPHGMVWGALLLSAVRAQADALVQAENAPALRVYLQMLLDAPATSDVVTVVPKLIDGALPLAGRDPALAEMLFILAARYLSVEALRHLLADPRLTGALPGDMAAAMTYLNRERDNPRPDLAETVRPFGGWSPLLLIRLAELTLLAQRYELLDGMALAGLARAAVTSDGDQFDAVFRWIVRALSEDTILPTLGEGVPRLLLQILLARRAYGDLANELTHQARLLYAGERQREYPAMVRRVFAETALGPDATAEALRALEAAGVKPLPLVMAHLGALKRHEWPDSLADVAANVTEMLFHRRALVDSLPPAALLELLAYHAARHDLTHSLHVAGLLPLAAASREEAGVQIMVQGARLLDWDADARLAALEVLRRYIRAVDEAFAWQAVLRLTEQFGEAVTPVLEATYALRELMGRAPIEDYAIQLRIAAQFLRDTSVPYVRQRTMPNLKRLQSDLGSVGLGLSDGERQQLAAAMLELAKLVVSLGREEKNARPRDAEAQVAGLLEGNLQPQTPLQVLRVLGGYFSRGRPLTEKLSSATGEFAIREQTGPVLLTATETALRVLNHLALAFPPDHRLTLSAAHLRGEIESLWGDLPATERRDIVRELATDLQMLPELVAGIYDAGDARVADDHSGPARKLDANKQQPESALEFYRFAHGFFQDK